MGFQREIEVTAADIKAANKLVAESKLFTAYTIYEQKRQEFRKAGTLDENEGLLEALKEMSKVDGDKAQQTETKAKKKGLFS